jgi:hypothetical protein
MQFKAPKQQSSLNLEIEADPVAAGLEETQQTLHKNLQIAQARQTKYAAGEQLVFELGDKVLFSTWYFRTTRPQKK